MSAQSALGFGSHGDTGDGWHAPGLGEVHNRDHSTMIFCCKLNEDDDEVPDDAMSIRVRDLLAAPPAVQPTCLGDLGECAYNKACMYQCESAAPPAVQPAAQAVQMKAAREAFDAAIDCAIILGATDALKSHGNYTETSGRVTVAMHESIAKYRAILVAAPPGVQPAAHPVPLLSDAEIERIFDRIQIQYMRNRLVHEFSHTDFARAIEAAVLAKLKTQTP